MAHALIYFINFSLYSSKLIFKNSIKSLSIY